MTKSLTSAEIRQMFLDYFAERSHAIVPSASLVPQDDPTLLFTNAGMNQFKDVFLGTGSRPYSRAADTQKCMRVSGKHNDLDDVGRDGTHHTLFEMLGNWSFGDYYKQEAIRWAWDLLTRVYGLEPEQLWATVFKDNQGNLGRDEEAAGYWRSETEINPDQILDFGRKDNFWEMGDTGPCGPCSEIHYDRGPEACDKQDDPDHVCRVNGDCQRFVEIWNLVFIQYNNHGSGNLVPLPDKHIDTGMGFERLVALLQGVDSNYRTDLFWPIIETTQATAGQTDAEREANLTAYRVIADHVRACTFLIGDGVLPANDGRGYVLRMVLRRAVRFGRRLDFDRPFMADLAELIIKMMGDVFPELPQRAAFIKATITSEEERFLRTLDQGLERLDEIMASLESESETVIPGKDAFFLHDTLGLPLEVTRDIAEERGFTVDEAGYHESREEQRTRARAATAFEHGEDTHAQLYPELAAAVESLRPNGITHAPYGPLEIESQVVGLISGEQVTDRAEEGSEVEVVLDPANFYVESGGQVSDTGRIVGPDWEIRVEEMREPIEGLVVHVGRVIRGTPQIGDEARAQVDADRRWDIMRNHTATHLLHRALRETLGEHVAQAGSLVAPDRLRFDFNYEHPLTPEQRDEIERRVTRAVLADYPVKPREENYRDALEQGVIALFGEKYGDSVRVLRVGAPDAPFSQELCGGTHVNRTGEIGSFLIVSENGIGAGVRRIEAVTGRGALAEMQALRARLERTAGLLETILDNVPQRAMRLLEELREARREIDRLNRRLAREDFEALLDDVVKIDGVPVLAARVSAPDMDTMREMADWFRDKMGDSIIVLGTVIEDKPRLIAATTKAMTQRGVHAGKLVGQIAKLVGGGGGGRPDMAQAGGRDADKLDAALAQVTEMIKDMDL
jgi:alanyl-tRNA synthetase